MPKLYREAMTACHALVALACLGGMTAHAADSSADQAKVTALADRYIAEYRLRFPLSYAFSGLKTDAHDGLDLNAPADLKKWRAFETGLEADLRAIKPETFAGQPEWVTWHFLNQTLREDDATDVCHSELWNVSAFGWQSSLTQITSIQPVGDDGARAQALTRWRKMGAWVDQEIANLKEGQRLGYSATQATVKATIGQLDGVVGKSAAESGLLEPAERAKTPAFTAEWTKVIESGAMPALKRYRDFLRDEYLPHARVKVSIESHPNGRECYRGLIFSTVTIDEDPVALFDVAVKEVERERAVALQLGKKLYGEKATDWNTLGALMRADPKNKFSTKEEVRAYTQRTYDRAYAAGNKMVVTPPVGKVKLEPFPEYQQESAPGGQYLPAADDGGHPATYYYRDVPKDLFVASMQNVILHETLPGHHLQIAFLAEHGRKDNHPVARLLFFSGPGEGWATYAEDFAREIGLYDSDLDYIGRLMGSITPMMVVDLGMQVKGWSVEKATEYLKEAMPMRPHERASQSVATISGMPGFVLAYPMGGMEWQKMRDRAQASLGTKFDVRAFHQMELEDGMLPFAALEEKLDRWIESQAK